MFENKILRIIGFSFVTIILFAFVAVLYVFSQINTDAERTAQIRFIVGEGEGVKQIAQNLSDQGAISSSNLFVIAVFTKGKTGELQAGEYIIPANASISKIVDLFSEGIVEDVITVRIPEESTSAQIAEYLESQGVISAGDFLIAANTKDSRDLFPSDVVFPVLGDKPDTAGLEGYLYPDTYEFYNDATAEDIIFKMLANLEKKLTQEDRDAITAQGRTIFEVMTLASIVEKEEPNKDEQPTVAGVFMNRIENGIPLQSDATVNFVTEGDNPQPTLADLATPSPYNTYLNVGLPPGPIANPTISAIRAAISPAETEYFYFLHPQDGSGRTIYGRTAEEHAQNKATYLP